MRGGWHGLLMVRSDHVGLYGWSWLGLDVWACGGGVGGGGVGHVGACWLGSSAGGGWLGVGPVVSVSACGGDAGLGGVHVGQKSGSMCPWGHACGGVSWPCGLGSSCVMVRRFGGLSFCAAPCARFVARVGG